MELIQAIQKRFPIEQQYSLVKRKLSQLKTLIMQL